MKDLGREAVEDAVKAAGVEHKTSRRPLSATPWPGSLLARRASAAR
jgi:hypothetical protein